MVYDGIKYKLTSYGAIVVSNEKKNRTEVKIPEVFEKLPVIEIGETAFAENMQLERVILPPTIKNIGKYAFYGCHKLREVIFAGACHNLSADEGAFCNCESLIHFNTPIVLSSPYIFRNCKSLESVSICENIPADTFLWCINLNEIHWHGFKTYGITVKTEGAFDNCNNLKKLFVYSDFIEIDEEDLKKFKNATIYCENTSNAAELAYEGCKIVFTYDNLPF